MKKAFSLLEIIIVVTIISIVSTMGLVKLFFTTETSHELMVKTQIHLIKNAIIQKSNESLLMGKYTNIEKLDNARNNSKGELLFSEILNQPLISSSEFSKKTAQWIKLSDHQYKIYVNATESLTFNYDSIKGSFECDYKLKLCQEMYQ